LQGVLGALSGRIVEVDRAVVAEPGAVEETAGAVLPGHLDDAFLIVQ